MKDIISGFTFDEVNVSWRGDCAYIDQGDDAIETTKDNMTQIAIQWLALNCPEALTEGE